VPPTLADSVVVLQGRPQGGPADGWHSTQGDVHDSQESWEKFRDGVLVPRMQAGIDGGFQAPPQETVFPVFVQHP
jgi:hypothetical protein